MSIFHFGWYLNGRDTIVAGDLGLVRRRSAGYYGSVLHPVGDLRGLLFLSSNGCISISIHRSTRSVICSSFGINGGIGDGGGVIVIPGPGGTRGHGSAHHEVVIVTTTTTIAVN